MAKRRNTTTLERREQVKSPERQRNGARPKGPGSTGPVVNPLLGVADAAVEASWLVAVVAIPLYFSAVTATGFEPDKAVLLRVLAVVAGAGALLGWVVRPRETPTRIRIDALLVAAMAVFAAFALATLFSIDRRLSLYGSLTRNEGLITYLAYATLLLAVATRLRTRAQLDRLFNMMIWGSIPAVAYGFIQQFGLDPLPTQGDPSVLLWPSRSTFGQHVFFGSYLVLVTPLTLARVVQNFMGRAEPTVKGTGEEASLAALALVGMVASFFIFLRVDFHNNAETVLFPAVLAGFVLLGLVFEAQRDTLGVRRVRTWFYAGYLILQVVTLGVVGARGAWFGFFVSIPVFAFLLAWWLRKPRIWWSVLGASVAVALFVFVLNIPNGPLQPLRTVHGLKRIANLTESGQAISSTVGRMDVWQAVGTLMTKNPSVGGAFGGPVRDVVGYGPDTMHVDFEAVFPLKLRRTTYEVWTWDRSHNIFLDYFVQAGLLGILSLFAVVVLLARRLLLSLRTADRRLALPLIGLGAAFAGRLADGVFGIEFPASMLLFWLIVAAFAALPRLQTVPEAEPERAPASPLRLSMIYWAPLVVIFIVVALISSLTTYATTMAAIWLASAVVGVAVVGLALLPAGIGSTRSVSRGLRRPARSGAHSAALVALAVATIVALGSQFEFENAAFRELVGLRTIANSNGLATLQDMVHSLPNEPLYWEDLGTGYLNFARAKYQSAEPGYRPVPGDEDTISPQRAILLGSDQLYQLAVYAFERATQLAPSDHVYRFALGDAYMRWNHPAQALAAFQQAERLSFENPKYLADEAQALVKMHQPQRAIAVAQQAIKLDPRYWFAYSSAALAYHAAGARPQTKTAAALALAWAPVFWPPPPQGDLQQMRTLAKTG